MGFFNNRDTESDLCSPFKTRGVQFERHNQRRINTLRSRLPDKKRDIFDLIPLLLHENDAGLPGNEFGSDTLSGISCFNYTPQLIALCGKYFPSLDLRQRGKPELPIIFLAVMGSAGTLAFTGKSDIDFWVGVETNRFPGYRKDALQKKLSAVEVWVNQMAGLEIHFFIADPDDLRNNCFGDLGGESCGTAMGLLLKDEFYRTAIFLEGKIPFFWIMEPGTDDSCYSRNISRLTNSDLFSHQNYADLGNVALIHPAEYSGAALWQILKGLHSPFKSVLKIALVDQYTMEGHQSRPLCDLYRNTVFSGQNEIQTDPYVFMVESVRDFYLSQNLAPVANLIEECFLIRNLLASREEQADATHLQSLLNTALRWHWSKAEIENAASFRSWEFDQVDTLRKKILHYFLNIYKRVRERTQDLVSAISEKDLNILGRKLRVFFEMRKGKVPSDFMLLSSADISAVQIEENAEAGKTSIWECRIRIKGSKGPKFHLLRTLSDPVEALGYVSQNGLYSERNYFAFKGRMKFSSGDAAAILEQMNRFFPYDEASGIRLPNGLAPMDITHIFIIPNLNHPQWTHGLTSVTVFLFTGIGELLYDYHQGEDTMEWLLKEILIRRAGAMRLLQVKWALFTPRETAGHRKRIADTVIQQIQSLYDRVLRLRKETRLC